MFIEKYMLTTYKKSVKKKCFICSGARSISVIVAQYGDEWKNVWVCKECEEHALKFVKELNAAYKVEVETRESG